MSSVLVVVATVISQQPTQVPLIEDDHMIWEIPRYTADLAFGSTVRPPTALAGPNRLASHCLHGCNDIGTKLGVTIEDKEALRRLAAFPGLCNCSVSQNAGC
jgi:hypothetical protein